jgi:hypothetical protein
LGCSYHGKTEQSFAAPSTANKDQWHMNARFEDLHEAPVRTYIRNKNKKYGNFRQSGQLWCSKVSNQVGHFWLKHGLKSLTAGHA